MSSITATVDDKRAQVRLDIDLSDVNAPNVTVTRLNVATGVRTVVRAYGSTTLGVPTTLVGRLVLYDVEAPLDVPLVYTASYNSGSVLNVLNANPYFENGTVAPWTPINNAALAASTVQFFQGGWSLRITPDGVTAVPGALSEEVAVTVGTSYTVQGSLWTTTGSTQRVGISWYDASHAFLSNSLTTVALGSTTWTTLGPSAFVAPATGFGRIVSSDNGTPAAANVRYLDSATISTLVNVSVSSGTVIVPSYGMAWLKDPVRPGSNVQLDTRRSTMAVQVNAGQGVAYLGLGDQQDKANSVLLNINNSAYPTAVSRLREAAVSSLRLMARSTPDVVTLKTLTAPGSSLLLQLPSAYQEDDRYLLAGDVTRSPVFNDQRRSRRLFSLPFATVLAPVGPMQGTAGVRWNDLCAHAANWGTVYAAGGGTYDGFNRVVAPGSWGSPDVPPTPGATYTLGGIAADMSVSSGVGMIAISVVNASYRAFLGSVADSERYLSTIVPAVALGAPYQVAVLARHIDSSNYYRLGIEFGLAGALLIFVTKRVANIETVVASVAGPTYAVGQLWRIHALVSGTSLKVSGWKDGTPEPVEFSVSGTDAVLAGAAPWGVYTRATTGNTNTLPLTVQVEDSMAKGSVTWTNILDGALA